MVTIKTYIWFILLFVTLKGEAQNIYVNSASQLQTALNNALPGNVIIIQDGYYERSGGFYANAGIDGTQANPITVIGSRNVVLSTNNLASGYAFSLKGNKHWIIKGFTVTNSKNGVVLDNCKYVTVDSIQAKKLGQDGVHLRTHTSYSVVKNCYIDSTGLNDYSYGEGIYIGSAYSNWCTYTNCDPDTSNYNQVLNNIFGNFITAENIDIKEGTKGGLIKGNKFNGTGLQGMNGGDSWIDVKGNSYIIEENIGNNSILDGFQTHIQQPGGYGNYNIFRNNTLNVNGPGYGIRVQTSNANGTAINNIVCTNNNVSGSTLGLTNVSTTNCVAVMPVNITYWNVERKQQAIVFSWRISSIADIIGFDVEGATSTNFSLVVSEKPSGNDYVKTVNGADESLKFFRLVVRMRSGEKVYSKVIQLNNDGAFNLHIQNRNVTVGSKTNEAVLRIYNEVGQLQAKFQLSKGINRFTLPADTLVCVAQITSPNGVWSKRFLTR
jgi:hypothetical protein